MAYADGTGIVPAGTVVSGSALALPGNLSIAAAAVLSAVAGINPIGAVRYFNDSVGNVWLYCDANGLANFPIGIVLSNPTVQGVLTVPHLSVADATFQNFAGMNGAPSVVNDSVGNIAFEVFNDGSVIAPNGYKGKFLAKAAMDSDGFLYWSLVDGLYGNWQIWKCDPVTGGLWKLTTKGNNYAPSISSDGSRLCFITDRFGAETAVSSGLWGGIVVPSSVSLANLFNNNFFGVIGQSFAVGYNQLALTTVASTLYQNYCFNAGPRCALSSGVAVIPANIASLIPLVEVSNTDTPSGNMDGETICSGAANIASKIALAQGFFFNSIAAVASVGAQPYSTMIQGTVVYRNLLAEIAAGKALSTAAGKSFGVLALMCLEGYADETNGNLAYDQCMAQWQKSYSDDIQALTGQLNEVPMLFDQDSNSPLAVPFLPYLQLKAHEANPGKLVLVGPEYYLNFNAGTGHPTNDSQRWHGELFGKVLANIALQKTAWRPLSPRWVQRQGAQILVKFFVPAGPLVIDTTTITPPTYNAAGLNGFEYFDGSGSPPAITAVSVVGADMVLITLASAPTVGPGLGFIRYAYTGTAGGPVIGPASGARGNLRDSDATVSNYGYALWNWCVHFNKPC